MLYKEIILAVNKEFTTIYSKPVYESIDFGSTYVRVSKKRLILSFIMTYLVRDYRNYDLLKETYKILKKRIRETHNFSKQNF